MIMTFSNILLVVTASCTALIAGLLYSYACSVNPGLKPLSDEAYITTMQSINRVIQNPVFFMSFMGTLLLLPISTYINYSQPPSARFWLLLVATILYVTGVFGVTMFGNVPLNNALDRFSVTGATDDAMRIQRNNFALRWNTLHLVRTVFSIVSLILVIMACTAGDKR